ncbi:UNKNOWN [Stylonychia lemnae]|uniref:Uncharacterized protein n=1 Tax=Stylonychia lemnae TaxID=5949 RepID=A0A077ZQL1_STYLE|nr:UNKNOWN [Stylonychia lemnae]|eukprot:CDW72197.1 UNKNOWN [Stylonychia lemnae]
MSDQFFIKPFVEAGYLQNLFSSWERPALALLDIGTSATNYWISIPYENKMAMQGSLNVYAQDYSSLGRDSMGKSALNKMPMAQVLISKTSILEVLMMIFPLVDSITAFLGIFTNLFSAFIVLRDPSQWGVDAQTDKVLEIILKVCHHTNTFAVGAMFLDLVAMSILQLPSISTVASIWMKLGPRIVAHLASGVVPNYLTLDHYLLKLI